MSSGPPRGVTPGHSPHGSSPATRPHPSSRNRVINPGPPPGAREAGARAVQPHAHADGTKGRGPEPWPCRKYQRPRFCFPLGERGIRKQSDRGQCRHEGPWGERPGGCTLAPPSPAEAPLSSSIHMVIHSFIHSLTHSLIHSPIHSFTHSFVHSVIHSSIHSLTHSLIHLFTRSLIHSPTHSFIHSLTHLFIRSFTHPFIHSFTRSLPPTHPNWLLLRTKPIQTGVEVGPQERG